MGPRGYAYANPQLRTAARAWTPIRKLDSAGPMTDAATVRYLNRTTPPHITTLVLLAGLGAMNMSVFLPSLPSMATHFRADYAVIQLAVSAYLGVTALLQLIIGPVSDRFGRRPVTLTCLAIFVAASIGCVLAPTVEVFLAFRMIQGAVVVGLVLSRAIIRDMFPQDMAASQIGYVTMGMALVPMVAPMIGGALEEAFGWQSTFLFTIAFGLGVFAISFADLGETAQHRSARFRDQVAEYPELLLSRRFWGYVAAAAFASGAFFAFLGGGPIVARDVFGLSAFWSGIGFGAPAIGYATGNFLSGRFSARIGVNRMVLNGTLITAFGMGLSLILSIAGLQTAFTFFAFCVTVGLGNGLVIPNASAGMLSVRPHLAGTASGLGSAFMVGGGAILSAVTGGALDLSVSATPLVAVMFTSAFFGLLSIVYVTRREAQLARADAQQKSSR